MFAGAKAASAGGPPPVFAFDAMPPASGEARSSQGPCAGVDAAADDGFAFPGCLSASMRIPPSVSTHANALMRACACALGSVLSIPDNPWTSDTSPDTPVVKVQQGRYVAHTQKTCARESSMTEPREECSFLEWRDTKEDEEECWRHTNPSSDQHVLVLLGGGGGGRMVTFLTSDANANANGGKIPRGRGERKAPKK